MITFIKIKPKPAPRPRVTKNGTYNNADYTTYKSVIAHTFKSIHGNKKSTNPIAMKIDFFFEIPKSWSKKKKESASWHISRPDTDNLVKGVKDALNGIAYKDDSQVCYLQARKQYAQFSGIRIEIEEMKDG